MDNEKTIKLRVINANILEYNSAVSHWETELKREGNRLKELRDSISLVELNLAAVREVRSRLEKDKVKIMQEPG